MYIKLISVTVKKHIYSMACTYLQPVLIPAHHISTFWHNRHLIRTLKTDAKSLTCEGSRPVQPFVTHMVHIALVRHKENTV